MRDFLQGDNFKKGLRISLLCLLLLVPNHMWKYLHGYSDYIQKMLPSGEVFPQFLGDMFMLWVALQISATAGYAWQKPPKLVGAGNLDATISDLKLIIPVALGIVAVEVFIFDLWLLKPLVQQYPKNPFASSAFIAEEVIFRFGILGIAFRLTRSVTASVLIAALFSVGAGLRGVYFDAPEISTTLIVAAAVKSFLFAVFYGFFCAKKGLLSTTTLRAIVGLRFAVYWLVGF